MASLYSKQPNLALTSGVVLVAPGTALPPTWRTGTRLPSSRWSVVIGGVVNASGAAAGWQLRQAVERRSATGVGFSDSRCIERACSRLCDDVHNQGFNCLKIDNVSIRNIFGLRYAVIAAVPQTIQQIKE
ncbi:hypothetical protein F183_A29450 [Bryobacterales bacterium F-183]|nr:hypothetical protein F183_A29450 [Bryobacterales bacterium F-183]